jgi:Putative protein-S-isoprenylcysteine methyltransferase
MARKAVHMEIPMLVFKIIVISIICVQLVVMTNNKQNKPDSKGNSETKNKTRIMMVILQLLSILFPMLAIANIYLPIGYVEVPVLVTMIGILLMVCGLIIRMMSMHYLGKYYSTLLFTNAEHKLITSGFYRYIRHPIYFGDILLYIGIGIALANYIVFIVITIFSIVAYNIRMNQEEKMMLSTFGNEYVEYSQKTKRVIPFIY